MNLSASAPLALTAVIIARNEEGNIAICIESVLRNLDRARSENLVESTDVVLVDSASTDRTVEIALRYPIRVLRLPRSWPLSAAAGRYIGFKHSSAPLILFLDGDEELQDGWLPKALSLMRSPDVAGVVGHENEATRGNAVMVRKWERMLALASAAPDSHKKTVSPRDSMGAGLVKRKAIESVGGIQPFLKAAEDRDLGSRLCEEGWKLLLTPEVMALHRWSGLRPFAYIDYFRSVAVWGVGDGQVLRYRFRDRALRSEYLRRNISLRHATNHLMGLLVAAVGLVNLLSSLSHLFLPLAIGIDGAILLALEGYRRSRKWTWRELAYEFHVIPYTLIRHGGFVLGMMKSTPDASRYPLNVEVVRSSGSPLR